MAQLISVVADDLTHLVATFDAAMNPDSLNGAANWLCTRSTVGAMIAEVISAEVQAGDQIVYIVVGPGMSPSETYTLSAPNAEDSGGTPLSPSERELAFVAPSILDSSPVPDSPLMNIEAVTLALAETLQQRAGPAVTFLVQPFGPDDTTALVESTLDFPASGAFFVNNIRFTYTSKGQMSLIGVALDPAFGWDGVPLPTNALLTGDIKSGPTTVFAYEQAIRDTVFTTAQGIAFDALVSMYGVPRPNWADEDDWRQAAKAVVWNVRGVLGSMFEFFYHALGKSTVTVTLDPAKPQTLTGTWTAAHISRLFKYDGKVYWSVALSGSDLQLCPVETGWWNRADFSSLPSSMSADVELLHWTFDAGGGQVRVYTADAALETPQSYLAPFADFGAEAMPATAGATRYLWMFGGPALYQDISSWPASAIELFTATSIPSDWAGTWSTLTIADQRTSPARGGSYTAALRVNGVDVATVVLGASASTAQTAGSWTINAGDIVSVAVTAGAGVSQALIQPRVSVSVNNPAGMPEGGYLGDDTSADDPYPTYLASTEFDEGFANTVQGLLAAGVWSDVRLVDFLTRDGY